MSYPSPMRMTIISPRNSLVCRRLPNISDGLCRVEIMLDYDVELFTIRFTEELAHYKLRLGYMRFDTAVAPLIGEILYIENYP